MDIYQALKKDHDEVKLLLEELVTLHDTELDQRLELINKIREGLIPHSRAEEAVLYNSMRMADMSNDGIMHKYSEHVQAEGILRTLQIVDHSESSWRIFAKQLKEALEHHIKDEEEVLFVKAQQVFTQEEAVAMAKTFEALKPDIKEDGLISTTLSLVANLMPPRLSEKFRSVNRTQPDHS